MNSDLTIYQPSDESIVVYQSNDGVVQLEVQLANETVWLTLDQMAELFQRNKSTISRHIKNIFECGELSQDVVVAKNATTTQHGALQGKTQTHEVTFYNLDMIISIGYRVNSIRGVQFRQWASHVLKEYLLRGYSISDPLKLDLDKHNKQYLPIDIQESDRYHDRFLILDEDIYHLGASLKDLGKKLFAFSKMELPGDVFFNILE